MHFLVGQGRQIEKAGDAVDIEKVYFARPPREADGEDGKARQQVVALPRTDRKSGEEIVFADDHVRSPLARMRGAFAETDGGLGQRTNAREESRDVLADIDVSCNAENEQFGAPFGGNVAFAIYRQSPARQRDIGHEAVPTLGAMFQCAPRTAADRRRPVDGRR